MEKIELESNNYFIGKNGVYLELQNTKELIDQDGIKRIVIEIKDEKKIEKLKPFCKDDSIHRILKKIHNGRGEEYIIPSEKEINNTTEKNQSINIPDVF